MKRSWHVRREWLILFSVCSASVAGVAAQSPAEQVAPTMPGYVVPRTSWGDPDLTGIWPSIDMVRVPVQRASQYGTRLFMSSEEHAEQEKREQEMIVRMAREGAGGATGAPGHWVEWGQSQRQTSLIIDPPDGRMPPLTAEGQARAAAAPRGTMGNAPLNGPEDFTMWERCISRGALGSTLPVLYNSGIDITQAPGYVVLRYEMVHDYRIIPLDGRPHLSSSIRQYMGDARGRWEGDTLVVDTTNYNGKTSFSRTVPFHSDALHTTERFTRVDANLIDYRITIDDPQLFTKPITIAGSFQAADPKTELMEFACAEGSQVLANVFGFELAPGRAQGSR
jgi:hypothetical protein